MNLIKNKKRGSLIIISGTTCAGKGTVINELLKRNKNLVLSTSYTSRNIRKGDIENETYYFISREKFEEKISNDDFLEYAVVHGNYYGTPKKEIEENLSQGRDVILEIEVQGAKIVKEKLPETVLIFILAPSMEDVRKRIIARGSETKEQVITRFKTAYQELNEINKYNYVVINDIVENAVKKIEAILISEKCRVDRIEEISVENREEFMHELLMEKDFDNTYKEIK